MKACAGRFWFLATFAWIGFFPLPSQGAPSGEVFQIRACKLPCPLITDPRIGVKDSKPNPVVSLTIPVEEWELDIESGLGLLQSSNLLMNYFPKGRRQSQVKGVISIAPGRNGSPTLGAKIEPLAYSAPMGNHMSAHIVLTYPDDSRKLTTFELDEIFDSPPRIGVQTSFSLDGQKVLLGEEDSLSMYQLGKTLPYKTLKLPRSDFQVVQTAALGANKWVVLTNQKRPDPTERGPIEVSLYLIENNVLVATPVWSTETKAPRHVRMVPWGHGIAVTQETDTEHRVNLLGESGEFVSQGKIWNSSRDSDRKFLGSDKALIMKHQQKGTHSLTWFNEKGTEFHTVRVEQSRLKWVEDPDALMFTRSLIMYEGIPTLKKGPIFKTDQDPKAPAKTDKDYSRFFFLFGPDISPIAIEIQAAKDASTADASKFAVMGSKDQLWLFADTGATTKAAHLPIDAVLNAVE